jgi:putative ABC transport system substrate-binding protein
MRRREFITIASGAAAWPLVAEAKQSPVPVVGFIGIGIAESTTSELNGFREGLSDSGYVDRRNVKIEYRWAEGQSSRSSALAAIKWRLSPSLETHWRWQPRRRRLPAGSVVLEL